jgi:hypothetical protein
MTGAVSQEQIDQIIVAAIIRTLTEARGVMLQSAEAARLLGDGVLAQEIEARVLRAAERAALLLARAPPPPTASFVRSNSQSGPEAAASSGPSARLAAGGESSPLSPAQVSGQANETERGRGPWVGEMPLM